MALMTPEQYIESIRKLKPKVYINGERVESVVDHPNLRPMVNVVAKTYELTLDPKYEDIMTATSHLTGEKVARWSYPPRSVDDLKKRCMMNTIMAEEVGTCNMRCVGTEGIHVFTSLTYAMDQEYGTEYYKRWNNFLKYIQENDLTMNGPSTDPKGDRSKRPLEQDDPDVHLHLVEKRADGIVVKGAKMHSEGAFACHEHLVQPPIRPLREGEEDYALCFAVPAGTPGITYICQSGPMEAEMRDIKDPKLMGNPDYGSSISTLSVYDNVFVPWERVFMCGEVKYTRDFVDLFGRVHAICCRGCCKVGFMELILGAAQTIAEYNGVERASHVVDKIAEMIRILETTRACNSAAIENATVEPSGVYFPDFVFGIATALNTGYYMPELGLLAADLAGGAVVTMASEKELQNPETKELIRKYLKGVSSVPTENRMRMLRFLQHWVAGPQVARMWHGGLSPQPWKVVLRREYQAKLEELKKLAKKRAGIKE